MITSGPFRTRVVTGRSAVIVLAHNMRRCFWTNATSWQVNARVGVPVAKQGMEFIQERWWVATSCRSVTCFLQCTSVVDMCEVMEHEINSRICYNSCRTYKTYPGVWKVVVNWLGTVLGHPVIWISINAARLGVPTETSGHLWVFPSYILLFQKVKFVVYLSARILGEVRINVAPPFSSQSELVPVELFLLLNGEGQQKFHFMFLPMGMIPWHLWARVMANFCLGACWQFRGKKQKT